MLRASTGIAILLGAATFTAPVAMAAEDDVSVSLTPGAGILLSGLPEVRARADGSSELVLGDVPVLNATGSGAGWELVAESTGTAGGGSELLLRADDAEDIVPVALHGERNVITVTVSPAF